MTAIPLALRLASTDSTSSQVWFDDIELQEIRDDRHQVIAANDYYPYGMTIASRTFSGDPEKDKFKYQRRRHDEAKRRQSKERDSETGYDYFEARLYDSDIGRFLQVDAYAEKYVDMNPYLGMGGNPLLYVDPTGDTLNTSGLTLNQITEMREAAYAQGHIVNIDGSGNTSFTAFSTAGVIPPIASGWLQNAITLSQSDVMYKAVNGQLAQGKTGNTTTLDGKSITMTIDPSQGGDFNTLTHEFSHAADFDRGAEWYANDGTGWYAQNNSIDAEYKAFQSQYQSPTWWTSNQQNNRQLIINAYNNPRIPTSQHLLQHSNPPLDPMAVRTVHRYPTFFGVSPKRR